MLCFISMYRFVVNLRISQCNVTMVTRMQFVTLLPDDCQPQKAEDSRHFARASGFGANSASAQLS